MQLKYVIMFFPFLDGQITSTGSSSTSDGDGDNHIYPGIIAAISLVFIIVVIVIIAIVIIVIKKKRSIRRSQQTATVAMPTPPQASVVLHTNATVSSQAPATNQSYPNPAYAQQQTPQVLTSNEATLTPVGPQPVVYYPYYHGAGHVTAVGSASNQSALPYGNKLELAPPSYSVCTSEGAPDGSTNNRSNLLPPDYAAAASEQVPPATNN